MPPNEPLPVFGTAEQPGPKGTAAVAVEPEEDEELEELEGAALELPEPLLLPQAVSAMAPIAVTAAAEVMERVFMWISW
ncbi:MULTISPECIES: hypothetical protein [Allobranchiibius]|uniref:Uncharacterized protein n=1 Tax=Allobranchiibius huperziae TaxID=1874116 RepID=A0A853DNB7_9MICO|nr:hypothetical protein [Allobranchiibius huperziae]